MQNPAGAVNASANEKLNPLKRGIAITLFTASAALYIIELVQSSINDDYPLLGSENLFFLCMLLTGGCMGATANPALKGKYDLPSNSFGAAFMGAFFVVFSNILAICIAAGSVFGAVFSALLTFTCLFSLIGILKPPSGVTMPQLVTTHLPLGQRQSSNQDEEISPLLPPIN